MNMKIIVSNGEIVDKMTILQLKSEFIRHPDKLKNIHVEMSAMLDACLQIRDNLPAEKRPTFEVLGKELTEVNRMLWKIEDEIRLKEKAKEFDEAFINLARNVYKFNDRRSDLKKEINKLTNSAIVEEKSYEKYE